MKLIPELLESRIPPNHVARFFLLIAHILNITMHEEKTTGRKGYHRPTALALVLYALYDGKSSAGSIFEFASMNLGAIFILGNMDIPSIKTIQNILNEVLDNIDAIHEQILSIIESIGLIGKKRVYIDGKKSKANASKHKAMSYKRIGEKIAKEEANLQELVLDVITIMEDFDDIEDEALVALIIKEGKVFYEENEADNREELKEKQRQLFRDPKEDDGNPSVPIAAFESRILPFIDEANQDRALELLDKVGYIASRLDKMRAGKMYLEEDWRKKHGNKPIPDKQQVNFTDPDSRIMTTKHHGVQQCYNHFAVVDHRASIILGVHTTNTSNDKEGFRPAFDHTEQLMKRVLGVEKGLAGLEAGADAGFFSAEIIRYGMEKKMDLYLSFPQPEGDFVKDKFLYNNELDYYTCPEGKQLTPGVQRKDNRATACYTTKDCLNCSSQKKCTKADDGIRKIIRNLKDEPLREVAIEKAKTEHGRMVLRLRKSVPEPVWGNMVVNDELNQMHYRGMVKVGKEFMLRCVSHNLRKLAKTFNYKKKVQEMLEKMGAHKIEMYI